MAKISIIVPVYCVEQYLERCVASVLKQSLSDIELILVDDGSPDRCPELCNVLAQKDSRIRVIHQKNAGLSAARNAGIKIARGEFIFFLDSDDILCENALRVLIDAQREENADIVVGSYYYTYDDREEPAQGAPLKPITLSNFDAMLALAEGRIQNFAWGKLLRAEIVKRHAFPEGRLFEDHYWAHLVFADAMKVVLIPTPIVHYVQRENSISYTFTSKRLDVLDGWQARLDFFQAQYPELREVFLHRIAEMMPNFAWMILTRAKVEKRKSLKRLQQFCRVHHLSDYAEDENKELLQCLDRSANVYAFYAIGEKVLKKIGRKKN